PLPDFDDYFLALGAFAERHLVEPGLLAETSRGCWWGMINHCTFCGLNGGGMTYRSKSPARPVEEFRTLSEEYRLKRFLVGDNILDQKYYRDVLPALAALPEKLELFYEITANVTFEQLERLRHA